MCPHDLTTGQTQYDRQASRLIYLMICDSCHAVVRRTIGPPYKPNFKPTPPPKSL